MLTQEPLFLTRVLGKKSWPKKGSGRRGILWKIHGNPWKIHGNQSKIRRNPWKLHGKSAEILENSRKSVENPWKTHGNPRKIRGNPLKIMENPGKKLIWQRWPATWSSEPSCMLGYRNNLSMHSQNTPKKSVRNKKLTQESDPNN